jgi:hypothetical protein
MDPLSHPLQRAGPPYATLSLSSSGSVRASRSFCYPSLKVCPFQEVTIQSSRRRPYWPTSAMVLCSGPMEDILYVWEGELWEYTSDCDVDKSCKREETTPRQVHTVTLDLRAPTGIRTTNQFELTAELSNEARAWHPHPTEKVCKVGARAFIAQLWKASASFVHDRYLSPSPEDGHDYTMRSSNRRMDQPRHPSEHHGPHESHLQRSLRLSQDLKGLLECRPVSPFQGRLVW